MFRKRIVIGGLPRSGSTLMRMMLDCHPSIVCGPEAGIFTRPYQDQLKGKRYFAKRFKRLYGLPRWKTWLLMYKSKTAVELFDRVMETYCRENRLEKDAWADKTPRNCLNYNGVLAEDSNVYFISTVRDGRDVVTSIFPPQVTYWCSIQRYVESLRAVHSFQGPRHLVVKYEDLVEEPEAFYQRMFDFLDEPFTPNILEDYRRVSATRETRKQNVRDPITNQWVGRWRKEEHAARIDEFYADAEAVSLLEKSGYDSGR